ncbi:uncharacterized protein ASCRUDRAFT_73869 [Ascoidea rubescens DSM 1968]|uniref:Uncharacterized protein n=1 Tax=Ascoidea rubescens DSM 1968 TaxID=1344418 RepID=A0A1D2VRF2_9ASCO|nr:hypothetical protein ASCRUDRAFT_73869 [Ascoidea rubescens DSM 1968]ODV64192.1 hypothetical protein ASCRUDRAFT_73869 [Ascoidea rubescens DSM 1968]
MNEVAVNLNTFNSTLNSPRLDESSRRFFVFSGALLYNSLADSLKRLNIALSHLQHFLVSPRNWNDLGIANLKSYLQVTNRELTNSRIDLLNAYAMIFHNKLFSNFTEAEKGLFIQNFETQENNMKKYFKKHK